jgi:hypothetical protein
VGDQNVVVINPTNEAKLDEIRDLLKSKDVNDPKTLLKKYLLGYVIFELDYKNEVLPYQSHSILEKYELDWSMVRFTKITADQIEIRLPDFKLKDGTAGLTNVITGGRKKVGNLGGATINELMIWAEILAIRENGVVFLIGFEKNSMKFNS